MKAETSEWVQKAEGDMKTAQREFAVAAKKQFLAKHAKTAK
jgi:hypothetical protein